MALACGMLLQSFFIRVYEPPPIRDTTYLGT
jgi:hypothetical protein